jgi:hypothetical protein
VSAPVCSQVLFATVQAVGDQVHLCVGMHHDTRLTLVLSRALAESVGEKLVLTRGRRLRRPAPRPKP